MKLNAVQRFIYSVAVFFAALIIALVFADGFSNGEMEINDTWGVWLIFILFQAWYQMKIWSNENYSDGYYRIKFFPNVTQYLSTKYYRWRTAKISIKPNYNRVFLVLVLFVLIAIAVRALFRKEETTTEKPQTNHSYSLPQNATLIEPKETSVAKSEYIGNHLGNLDSPFDACFGKGIYGGDITLTVKNGTSTDAVVCLYEPISGLTVRNEYVLKNTSVDMTGIVYGKYYIRVLYGTDWNPNISNPCGSYGYFENNLNYTETDEARFFNNKYNYEYTLNAVYNGNSKSSKIDKSKFFN